MIFPSDGHEHFGYLREVPSESRRGLSVKKGHQTGRWSVYAYSQNAPMPMAMRTLAGVQFADGL